MKNNINVIILAGQSNCSGYTFYQYLLDNDKIDQERKNLYVQGFPNALINYSNNIYGCYNLEFEPVKLGMGDSNVKFGIELGFAEYFYDTRPNEKIYIIKFSCGGTSIHQDWASTTSSLGSKLLYENFIAFVNNSLNLLKEQGFNPIIKGMCWMQGESDAIPSVAQSYYSLEKALIKDIREQFKEYLDEKEMPFVDAEISDSPLWESYYTINQAKKHLYQEGTTQVLIKTIEEGLTYNLEPYGAIDYAHYDSASMLKLGRLFAKAICAEANL